MNYEPMLEFESFLNEDKKLRVRKDKKPWYLRLLPNEKPYNEVALISAMSENIYLMADLHIGDPIENWQEKRDKIISMINAIVKPDEHLLILGDLSAHTNTANMDDVRNTIAMIQCKNMYLILGNNDQADIDTYVKMGFKTVTDRFVWKNYIFSHMPEKIYGNMINIHGHIHEEIQYIDVDWHNHINVWDNQYRPIRLKEVIQLFNSGYYKGVTINSGDELKDHTDYKYFGTEESVDIVTEGLFGEKIDKNKLSDPEYVKQLTKKIRDTPDSEFRKRENFNTLLSLITMISSFASLALPVITPVALLMLLSVNKICDSIPSTSQKELDRVSKSIDKVASRCKDPEIKKKLLDNKKLLNTKSIVSGKVGNPKSQNNNAGKYINGCYWITNKVRVVSLAAFVIEDINSEKEPRFKEYDKDLKTYSGRIGYQYIEYLAGITNIHKLLEDDKMVVKPNDELCYDRIKVIRNKTITSLVDCDADEIVYCHEDKCCYSFNVKYDDEPVQKISLDAVMKAAEKTYKDYQDLKSKYKQITESSMVTEACKDVDTARKFVYEVGKLAKKYNANYFIVTDGASGISNNGNPAVKHARDCHIEWEKKHGQDPYEDWSHTMETAIPNSIAYSTDFNLAKSIYDKLSDEDKFFYLEGEPYTDKPNNIYRQVMLIDGIPAGFIEINTAVSRVFNYVGVVVSEAFRNQGVATTLFHKLLEDYDYKSGILMLWNAHIRNVKSQNLALRLGFDEIKSFTEDHKLYKMTTDTANTIKYLTELENRKNIDV